jgi:Flp pilus assembly protein TadG
MNRNSVRYRSQSSIADRRGVVTVEFAICASIFFTLILGMLEFSRFIYVQHAVQMVAYEAARVGIVPGASRENVEARAASLLAASGVRVADVFVSPAVINNLTEQVSVNVNCDFANNSWISPSFLASRAINSTITLQHENMAYLRPGDQSLEAIIGNNDNEPIDE